MSADASVLKPFSLILECCPHFLPLTNAHLQNFFLFQVDFSYDRSYLIKHLKECSSSLHFIVQRHLTDKSLNRIDHVFDFFSNPQFLDTIFKKDSNYREILGKIVSDMNKALDTGGL